MRPEQPFAFAGNKKFEIYFQDEYIQKWEDTSKDVIGTFLGLFGHRDWNFEHFWNNSKRRITQALSPTGSPEHSDDEEEKADDIIINEEPSSKRPRQQYTFSTCVFMYYFILVR